MKSIIKTIALSALALSATGALRAEDNKPGEAVVPGGISADTSSQTIVEVASGMNNFTTLVAAVKAAGLAETLSGDGPFTVFAPTNEAFAKLPEGTVEDLMKPENKDKLRKILMFHVVPGKVMAADVKTMAADTAGGMKADVKVMEDGGVTYAGQKVIKTDVMASNGVIHWIDGVAMPKM